MKKIFILLILFLIAVYLGLWMKQDSGYVLITYKNWSVETTLWVLIIAIFLAFIIFNFIIGLFNIIIGMPNFLKNWFTNHKIKKARKQTKIGLYAWAEGKLKQSERLLIKSAPKSDIPLINYLIATHVAHKQGNFSACDIYLDKARMLNINKPIAADLLQAQLFFDSEHLDEAIIILNNIRQLFPNNEHVLRLLYKAYVKVKGWQQLLDLWSDLYKYKILSKPQLEDLERNIYINLLSKKENFISLHNFWSNIPRYLRHDNEILLAYVEGLIRCGNNEILVEKLLRYALKKSWDERLIEKYGLITGAKPIKQLAFAEGFLNDYRNDINLLLCLGRLCKKLQLWGKSQNYFEIGMRLQKSKTVFNELGQLMDLLNRKEVALEYYRKAALFV